MTDLVRDMDEEGVKGLTSSTEVWKTADQGAATMLVAALDPKLAGRCSHSQFLRCRKRPDSRMIAGYPQQGVYLDDCQLRRPSKWAVDAEKAERLWKLSEELEGEKFRYGASSRR
jgi:hypothetical protein